MYAKREPDTHHCTTQPSLPKCVYPQPLIHYSTTRPYLLRCVLSAEEHPPLRYLAIISLGLYTRSPTSTTELLCHNFPSVYTQSSSPTTQLLAHGFSSVYRNPEPRLRHSPRRPTLSKCIHLSQETNIHHLSARLTPPKVCKRTFLHPAFRNWLATSSVLERRFLHLAFLYWPLPSQVCGRGFDTRVIL